MSGKVEKRSGMRDEGCAMQRDCRKSTQRTRKQALLRPARSPAALSDVCSLRMAYGSLLHAVRAYRSVNLRNTYNLGGSQTHGRDRVRNVIVGNELRRQRRRATRA